MPFQALGLRHPISKAVREAGYTGPTPIQAEAIPPILAGRDLIGIAQTGTGKTAAFVLPILERLAGGSQRRHMRSLILAPTRELAVQIHESLRKYGRHLHLKFTPIYGGVGEQPQIAALRRGIDIVVATPGRLIDLMERRHVIFDDVELVVLDEADRMLDMGFLPPIRQIMRQLPAQRQTLLFSATFSKEIEKVAAEFLRAPVVVEIGPRSRPIDTVSQFVHEVSRESKIDLLIHLLRDPALNMVLVFSRTRHGADKIARKLAQARIETATIHSDRSQSQRAQALRRFKAGEVRVLVATDIAARGIDVEGISHVVNYDFPPQPEDYVHRIGRTGRMEAVGDAISFVTADDRAALHALERILGRRLPRISAEGFAPKRLEPTAPPRTPSRAPHHTRAGEHPRKGQRPQRPEHAPGQREYGRHDRGSRDATGRPQHPRGFRPKRRGGNSPPRGRRRP